MTLFPRIAMRWAAGVLLLTLCAGPSLGRGDDPLATDRFHVIINTDCSPYSDWMAEGFIYTHFTSNTPGGLTRICSCDDPNYVYPHVWHPRMKLQLTPDFRRQTTPNGKQDNFVHYNRVMGTAYWLKHQGAALPSDAIIVMADADFVIGLPMDRMFQEHDGRGVVHQGRPAAQIYLIGDAWFDRWKCKTWMEEECGSECKDTTSQLAGRHYMVGAPYAMTKADWVMIMPEFLKYTMRVREEGNAGGVDEMFGYVLACMHYGLRHATTTEIMISYPGDNDAEAWHFVTGMDPNGRSAQTAASPFHYHPNFRPDGRSAPVLHYCQNAKVEGLDVGSHFQFSKYEFDRQPLGLPNCEPLPEYKYHNDKLDAIIANQTHDTYVRRNAFLMRHVPHTLHQALLHYRDVACLPTQSLKAGASDQRQQVQQEHGSRPVPITMSGSRFANRPLFGTRRAREAALRRLPHRRVV